MSMRDSYIDTSKAILIFLVVFGHFLERCIGYENEASNVLIKTIYFVHMPAFIFISGMFFKGTDLVKKIVYFLSLLIPFQIAYVAFESIISQSFSLGWLVKPYWILWYLVGMIVWTILTPLLKKTEFPVLISVFLSVLVGFSPVDNYLFSIGRIFTFLPFFVVGSLYGKQIVNAVKSKKVYALFGFLALISIVLISKYGNIESGWLYGSLSYKQLGADYLTGSLTRLTVFTISFAGIVAILAVIQLLKDKFVSLGQHTLPVYLLHGFVVIILAHFFKFQDNFTIGLIVSFALTIVTCVLLKLDIFEKLIKFISNVQVKLYEKM